MISSSCGSSLGPKMLTGGMSNVTRQYDGKRRSSRIRWGANVVSGRLMMCSWILEGCVSVGARWFVSNRLAQRSECGSHLGGKQRRLFPSGEMTASVELVVINEFGISPFRPAARRRIDFVGEGAHGDRDRDAPDVEEPSPRRNPRGVPVEPRRGDRGVRQPIERDVVEDVVPR